MTLLQNKIALVTGASRGIGRATALALARAGAHVLVHLWPFRAGSGICLAAIEVENGRANAVSADLGTPDGAALLAKQVCSIVGDRLDVLVLNAGISKSARIADYTVELRTPPRESCPGCSALALYQVRLSSGRKPQTRSGLYRLRKNSLL